MIGPNMVVSIGTAMGSIGALHSPVTGLFYCIKDSIADNRHRLLLKTTDSLDYTTFARDLQVI